MNHKQAKMVFGTALGAAAIAVAIDHTRQQLPEPQPASQEAVIIIEAGEAIPAETADCGKKPSSTHKASPCSL